MIAEARPASMFLTAIALSTALGVTEAELSSGATWHLPGGEGAGVTVTISHDEEGYLSVAATESAAGEDSSAIAWLSGTPREDGYDISGHDGTGEASNSEDPRSAAVAIRRQINAIRQSEGGRKVA
jgi:hypothetical protein